MRITDGAGESASCELDGEIESALGAEVDVHQGEVGPQLTILGKRFDTVAGDPYDRDTRALEHAARGIAEVGAVIDDQTAHGRRPEHHMNRVLQNGHPVALPVAGISKPPTH